MKVHCNNRELLSVLVRIERQQGSTLVFDRTLENSGNKQNFCQHQLVDTGSSWVVLEFVWEPMGNSLCCRWDIVESTGNKDMLKTYTCY